MKCTLHVKIAVHTAQLITRSNRITDAQHIMQNMFELLQDLEKDLVGRRMEKHRWCPTIAEEFGDLVQSNCRLLGQDRAKEIFNAASWIQD